jgi:hypothetical protein
MISGPSLLKKWNNLLVSAIKDRDLDVIDSIFSSAADFNKTSKLAMLDVVKSEGFDIDMKLTGKNMIEVICEQIGMDVELYSRLKKMASVDGSIELAVKDLSHVTMDDTDKLATDFLHGLIYDENLTEIIKSKKGTFLGNTELNRGYPLKPILRNYAELKVNKFNLEVEIESLQSPEDKIVWGANPDGRVAHAEEAEEQYDLVSSMGM